MTADRFDLTAIRERVLAAWSAAPVRFREDANAEEELALGGYRDRLVVELAQNAADAATRAGTRGRLLLALRELDGGAVLVAANTGDPIDRDGVQALATLRASAKRDDDSVGRFGVGFAAVLAVTDSPAVVSRSGGVRFSGPDTRALVEQLAAAEPDSAPGLHEELARRDGHVPVLRLPFEAEGSPPDGYDTAVLLPLRDAAAEDLVVRLLAEVGDPLLLALPGLDEIVVDLPDVPRRVLAAVGERWHVLTRAGRFAPGLLADRPTEERRRLGWQVTWALPAIPAPAGASAGLPTVLHAPTPSDEPLPWPALLIGSFPLDSTRRHVAPGPATDLLVGQAAGAYADLLAERAEAGDDVLPLVPSGLAAGRLDGALRAAVLAALPAVPLLPEGGPGAADRLLVRPRDAVALDPPAGADADLVVAMARSVAGLVLAPRSASGALAALGVRRMPLADLVEALPAVPDPERWRQVYRALDPLAVDPLVREALADLPVPLADGRVVRGARGVLVPSGPVLGEQLSGERIAADLAVLGVRVVDPRAAHPLLERLGASVVGARGILGSASVQAAVEAASDQDDPQPVVDAVLALVAAAVADGELAAGDPAAGDLVWLADLPLLDADGEPTPAGALALPGSVAAAVFDPEEIGLVDEALVLRWGPAVLAAVGVLDGPALLRASEVPLDPDGTGDDGPNDPAGLDGWPAWVRVTEQLVTSSGPPPVLAELVAVRDLDAVPDDQLPRLVEALAVDPALRAAVLEPVRVLAAGGGVHVPSYTAWWLRRRVAGGSGPVLDPQADPLLHGLFPPAPDWLARVDDGMRRALSAVRRVEDLGPDAAEPLVRLLAEADREVPVAAALACWRRLAELGAAGVEVESVDRVRVLDPGPGTGGTRVVEAVAAVVVDAPMYLQRSDLGAPLVVPSGLGAGLADLLDLPLATELAAGEVQEQPSAGERAGLPGEVAALLAAVAVRPPQAWCEHADGVLVDGVEVEWWVDGEGLVHAGTMHGLADGLAWACGVWGRRAVLAQLLLEPGTLAEALVGQVFSPAGG